jgi:hypothetical protein
MDNQEKTIKKGQSRKDNQERTIKKGQSRKDNQEWTIQTTLEALDTHDTG